MARDRLDIIYEDKEIIVVNKPAHLLTISTSEEKIKTLYHKVYEYVHKKHKSNRVFIVHRLDKDTSGLVLFAKNPHIKEQLQSIWNDETTIREYLAIVEKSVNQKRGTIREYLKETSTLHTIKTSPKMGKLAITNYEVINKTKNYSVLKITIETGRKNQIRVAMQGMNHPIIGDKKYGSAKNPLRRMCLHAHRLEFIHPLTHKKMEFVAKIPSEFKIFEMNN